MQPMSHLLNGSDDEVANGILDALLAHTDPLVRYESLTRAQTVYEALARRIAAERARTVAEMHDAGLSYGRIAETIGFTRARAQQLVERAEQPTDQSQERKAKTMSRQDQITGFLESYVANWPRSWASAPVYRLHPPTVPPPVAHQYGPEQLAADLLAQAEFRVLQLGTWLSTPDARLITAAVESLAPPLYREDIELLVGALTLAAQLQQRDARSRAAKTAVLVAVGGALLAAAANGSAS